MHLPKITIELSEKRFPALPRVDIQMVPGWVLSDYLCRPALNGQAPPGRWLTRLLGRDVRTRRVVLSEAVGSGLLPGEGPSRTPADSRRCRLRGFRRVLFGRS